MHSDSSREPQSLTSTSLGYALDIPEADRQFKLFLSVAHRLMRQPPIDLHWNHHNCNLEGTWGFFSCKTLMAVSCPGASQQTPWRCWFAMHAMGTKGDVAASNATMHKQSPAWYDSISRQSCFRAMRQPRTDIKPKLSSVKTSKCTSTQYQRCFPFNALAPEGGEHEWTVHRFLTGWIFSGELLFISAARYVVWEWELLHCISLSVPDLLLQLLPLFYYYFF